MPRHSEVVKTKVKKRRTAAKRNGRETALRRPSALAAGAIEMCSCFYAAFFLGTFAPFLRASESPMAIACLRLFTLPPLPPGPDFSVPCFFRRIALSTVLPADLL